LVTNTPQAYCQPENFINVYNNFEVLLKNIKIAGHIC
ncbi:MAG: hypothetical protein RLZZ574_2086, partial [Cyanobacteriota bacterium]